MCTHGTDASEASNFSINVRTNRPTDRTLAAVAGIITTCDLTQNMISKWLPACPRLSFAGVVPMSVSFLPACNFTRISDSPSTFKHNMYSSVCVSVCTYVRVHEYIFMHNYNSPIRTTYRLLLYIYASARHIARNDDVDVDNNKDNDSDDE